MHTLTKWSRVSSVSEVTRLKAQRLWNLGSITGMG